MWVLVVWCRNHLPIISSVKPTEQLWAGDGGRRNVLSSWTVDWVCVLSEDHQTSEHNQRRRSVAPVQSGTSLLWVDIRTLSSALFARVGEAQPAAHLIGMCKISPSSTTTVQVLFQALFLFQFDLFDAGLNVAQSQSLFCTKSFPPCPRSHNLAIRLQCFGRPSKRHRCILGYGLDMLHARAIRSTGAHPLGAPNPVAHMIACWFRVEAQPPDFYHWGLVWSNWDPFVFGNRSRFD